MNKPFAPFPRPVPIPGVDFDEGDLFQVQLSGAWVGPVLGALETLLELDAWQGDAAEQLAAVDEATRLIASIEAV